LAHELGRVLRLVLAVITPLAIAAAILAPTAIRAIAHGGIRANAGVIGLTVAAFAPAMVAFSVHYVMLRGFYAMENTRTPFCIQLVVAATNIAAAIGFTRLADTQHVPVALALAFGVSYLIGTTLSVTLLPGSRAIFDADTRRFLLRLVAACVVTAAVMLGSIAAIHAAGVPTETPGRAFGLLVLVGPVGAGTYLVASRLLGLTELASVIAAVRRRS
jgi:putative peptidoglycan lipid II flippase